MPERVQSHKLCLLHSSLGNSIFVMQDMAMLAKRLHEIRNRLLLDGVFR